MTPENRIRNPGAFRSYSPLALAFVICLAFDLACCAGAWTLWRILR